MALSVADLATLRQEFAYQHLPSAHTKADVNTALNAIENLFETQARSAFGNAIESAVPGTFTAAEKKTLVKFWLRSKFGRE